MTDPAASSSSPDPLAPDDTSLGLEGVVALVIALGITALLIAIDAFDLLADAVAEYEDWQLDEIILGGISGLFVYAVFSMRAALSHNRRLQAQLQRNEVLSRQVTTMYHAMAGQNRDLERAAWVMSHEFREPLRAINQQIQLIGRRWGKDLPPEDQEGLETCHRAVERLDEISHALGEYLGQSTGPLPCYPVNSRAVLLDVVQSMSAEIATAIMVDTLPNVMADRGELAKVMRHLLDNAAKFRRPERPLQIRVFASQMDEDVCLAVEDNGIGVAEEQRDSVFRLMPYIHPRGAYKGQGTGLATCRRAVHRMGGRLWLDGAASGGCLFRIQLRKA